MSRNKSVKIGTTAQNATAETTADREGVENLSFPRKLRVTNQMPIPIVFPELGLYLIGNTRVPKQGEKKTADVKFANEAQLKRFEADAETLANIHKYNPAVLIEEIATDAVPASTAAPAVTPAAGAAATGAAAAPKANTPQETAAPAATAAPVAGAVETPAGAQSHAA
jgi:hypothetical protein